MKNIWIIANWKSNKTTEEALEWIAQVGPQTPRESNLKVVVCPIFSALSEVKKAIIVDNFPLKLGVQDLSPFGIGAYTGEEPAELLNQIADLAILGHSERRQNFGETDEMVVSKVNQAIANNITPLVCVQDVESVVPEGCKLTAYEPIFAIGNGNADTPENANKVGEELKIKNGGDLEVLYGGSVTSENVKGFIDQLYLSGVLVGKASLDAQEFIKICKIALE